MNRLSPVRSTGRRCVCLILAVILGFSCRIPAQAVIGGKDSANTRALHHLAVESGVKSWHIEDEREVIPEMYDCDILGITAGASTPAEVIDAVVRRLEQEHP